MLSARDGAKVSYQTLSIINRHTHPLSLTHQKPGEMRSNEDGVHAKEEQPIPVSASNGINRGGLATFGHTNLCKIAANLETVSERARGTSHCEPYRQEYNRTKKQPAIRSALSIILLLGLDAILDSLFNRSCWRS